jgi:AcrR family transcriptional regulator
MIGDFISARDRIISASIDIISDAGLESLTIPIISMRTNINEMMIYKYFSDTDEILEEIVATYFRFDKSVFKSIEAQNDTYLDMISAYVNQYGTYYDSYYSLSAIMLQYEELLHNTETRETMVQGFIERRDGLAKLFDDAVKSGELKDSYDDPRMLADLLLGIFVICSINRRVMNRKRSYKEDILLLFDNWINTIIREV